MASAAVPYDPPGGSAELLWQLVQHKRIEAFNEASSRLQCWPVVRVPSSEHSECHDWMVVVIAPNDCRGILSITESTCQIQIGQTWSKAIRVKNPSASIRVGGHDHWDYVTFRVTQSPHNDSQPAFTPSEMVTDSKDGGMRPNLNFANMISINIHLKIKSSPQLDNHIARKTKPEASWKFAKHFYNDIFKWGTEEEFEFEAASIREFNRGSVYKCWLVLCNPRNDELPPPGSKGVTRQQCLVIMGVPQLREEFPRVGELCDLAFREKMPELEDNAKETKDNKKLKRRGVKYLGGTRLDNPYETFALDPASEYGSSWLNYCTFKVSVYKESNEDYSPLDKFACKLDWSTISRHDGHQKARITLLDSDSFEAHVWLDISTTTKNVELNALKQAMEEPFDSRIGKAFSYIRTLEAPTERFNLFQVFPHMHPDSKLPDNLRAAFQRLDEDQKQVYKTFLANLPARVGIIPAGPGTGKTELMLTISALALSSREATETSGGPILLILEANRPANAAATRVIQYFNEIGCSDLRILRAYNFNYEGVWGARRYLKTDDRDDASSGPDFDELFQTHRPDHVPQLRRGLKGECLAPNLKEAAQQYLREHLEDFPLMSELLCADDPDEIKSNVDLTDDSVNVEWEALFTRVLAETHYVITTPVGAAKIAAFFKPSLVLFDEAARARELGTLVSIANFPSAEAWLFTGTVEMTKPYLASHGSRLWNPCANQLRTSLMERYLNVVPDTHRLSLNHQAYGNLHSLSSDLFWSGGIFSALPSEERFPPSTAHLLDYCRSLASNQELTVPRLLVHVRRPEQVVRTHDQKFSKSKFNARHLKWVMNRIVRDLLQDQHFRSTGNEPGSIIIITPYKAQFTNYRKAINGLLHELDREHRLAGGHGNKLHREISVQASTADTCQAHAADVVIFDFVSQDMTSHVADPSRLASALTRAKQAEFIIMERSMLFQQETGRFNRGYDIDRSYIDEMYEHCRSRGQIITVDPVDDSQVKKEYSLHRADAGSGPDPSAVPRQLPELPSSLDLPRNNEGVDAPVTAAPPDLTASGSNDDGGSDGDVDGMGFEFGFGMVRKAMELGLKLTDPST